MAQTRRLAVVVVLVFFGTLLVLPAGATIPAPNHVWGTAGSSNGQFNSPVSIAVAPSGDLYVADRLNHRVQQFTSAGVFVRAWGTAGVGNGQFNAPQGIAIDSTGNVFVSDGGNNRIQKFSATGAHLLTFGSATLSQPAGLAYRGVTLFVADSANDRIRRFNGVSGALLGTIGAPGTGNGQFDNPRDVDVDSTGQIYVVDQNNNRIQKLNASGTFLAKIGATGAGNGQFAAPRGITVVEGSPRRILVADTLNHRIQEFSDTLVFQSTLGTLGTGVGQFDEPRGITVDPRGNVFVSEGDNNRVQRLGFFAAPPPFVRTWPVPDDGAADIPDADSVAVDTAGNVYVLDDPHVQVFDPSGAFLRNIVIPPAGAAIASEVAVDAAGNVYVSQVDFSSQPSLIDKYNPQGQLVDLIGINTLAFPNGMAVSPVTGNLFVADLDRDKYYEFTAAGALVRQVGSFGSGNGQFQSPSDIAVDASGNVYVTDPPTDRIQVFGPTGTFLRSWSAPVGGNGGLSIDSAGRVVSINEPGSVGTGATIFTPTGAPIADVGTAGSGNGQFQDAEDVVADSRGNLYITDADLLRVQRFGVPGTISGTVTRSAGAASGVLVVALGPPSLSLMASAFTNASGQYTLTVPPGRYTVGYVDLSGADRLEWFNNKADIGSVAEVDLVTLNAGGSASANAALTPTGDTVAPNPATINGNVTSSSGAGLPAVVVLAMDFNTGRIRGTTTTNSGSYSITGLHPGSGYRVEFIDPTTGRLGEWHNNRPLADLNNAQVLNLTAGSTTSVNASLEDNPAF
jgi:sugar lactone lactonase YvrE